MVKHYFVDLRERSGAHLVASLIFPLIGVVLTVWLWTSLSGLTLVIGLCWPVIGFLWLWGVTRGFRGATPVPDPDYE